MQKNRYLELNELLIVKGKTMTIDPKEVYGYSFDSLIQKSGFSFSNFLTGEGFSSYEFKGPAMIYTYKWKPADYNDFSIGGALRFLFLWALLYLLVKFLIFIL